MNTNFNSGTLASNNIFSNTFNSFESGLENFKKKLKNNIVKSNEDVDIYYFNESIYFVINNNINNIYYIKEIISYIFPRVNLNYMYNERIIVIDKIKIKRNLNYEEKIFRITNILEYVQLLGEKFIFKEMNERDFIITNKGIIFINFDNILPKIRLYNKVLYFESMDGNVLKQNFSNILSEKKIFIDEVTQKSYSYEEIPKIKEWEKCIEEGKRI